MPIDPSLSLNVRQPHVNTPMESFQRAVSIRDMMANMQERKETEKLRKAEIKLKESEIAAKEREMQEKSIFEGAINKHTRYDPAKKDLDYDDAAIAEELTKQNAGHLLPQFTEKRQVMLEAAREREKRKADDIIKQSDIIGIPAENFLTLPEDRQAAQYPALVQAFGRINPAIPQQMPPQFDENAKQFIQGIANERKQWRTFSDQLKEAQDRTALAAKGQPKVEHFPPGSLLRITYPDGRVEERQVPFKSEDKNNVQIEREDVEEAYGQIVLKGIPREKMTAAQRVAARRWDEAAKASADPSKKTDHDKKVELALKDPTLFKFVYPSGETTPAELARANNAILDNTLDRAKDGSGRFNPAAYELERKIWKRRGVDLPELTDIKKDAAGNPTFKVVSPAATGMGDVRKSEPEPSAPRSSLPKPAKKGAAAPAAILKQYLEANGGDQAKTLAALEAAGWK